MNQNGNSPNQARCLGRFKQIFPLTLFPDELIIEEHRVVLVINRGPWIQELLTTMATDIASVDSSTGPLFGHIHIKSLTGGPDIFLDRMTRGDVLKARYMVEGVILLSRRGETMKYTDLDEGRSMIISKGKIN